MQEKRPVKDHQQAKHNRHYDENPTAPGSGTIRLRRALFIVGHEGANLFPRVQSANAVVGVSAMPTKVLYRKRIISNPYATIYTYAPNNIDLVSMTDVSHDSLVTGDTLNNLNQLKTRQGGTGVLPIRGMTNEPAWVFVNRSYATVNADNTVEGEAAVAAGNNTVTVAATDTNGNTTTNNYNVVVTGSGSKTLVYDPNGNLTSDGTRTFEWIH